MTLTGCHGWKKKFTGKKRGNGNSMKTLLLLFAMIRQRHDTVALPMVSINVAFKYCLIESSAFQLACMAFGSGKSKAKSVLFCTFYDQTIFH